MAETNHSSSLTLTPGLSLGMNSAEADDEYLAECFVKTPAYNELTNFDSSRMIALGRTGAGKTAILRGIQNNFGKTTEIDPIDISMEYISGSTVLQFLDEIGADLDLLFQVIWKHVLCVEYIRLRYNIKDQSKWQGCLRRLEDAVHHDDRRRAALNYLKQYDGKFWVSADENLKEIVERINDKLAGEIGLKKYISGGIGRDLSLEEKRTIISRFKQIVTTDQLTVLSNLISLLADDEEKHGPKNFILIDKLDEQWVEDRIRFRMIRALIEALRRFRKIRRLKIVVALRTDVLERVLQETATSTFQREKHDDYAVELRWTPVLLMQVVQERLDYLSLRKLGGRRFTFNELFPTKIGSQTLAAYIVERTLHRPRDFIAYINLCLRVAEGRKDVTASIVRGVEREYSNGRFQALVDEWKGAFPCMQAAMQYIARFNLNVSIQELRNSDGFDDLIETTLIDEENSRDPTYAFAEAYFNGSEEAGFEFIRQTVQILYRVGAVGVRRAPGDKIRFSHIDMPTINSSELEEGSTVRLHPMFAPALRANEQHDNDNHGDLKTIASIRP
jgi:hypothetical protein